VIAVRLLADGAVVREAVFRDLPISIGRGADSDFAIVDPSVSRRHARVVADPAGAVWIEDAGSVNGLGLGATRVDRAAVPITGSLRLSLGSAQLEVAIASPDATLALAAPRLSSSGWARASRAAAYWGAGIAAWAGITLLDSGFWSPWEQSRQTKLSWLALGVAVGLPIVAFVLMGLLRIVGRKARLGDVLRALAVVSSGWVVFTIVHDAAAYVLGVRLHSLVVGLLGSGGLVASVAYLASIARPGPRRRFFLAWSAAIAFLVAAFAAAGRLAARQAGTPQLDYDVAMPIAGVTGPASDLDRYLGSLRTDFQAAEKNAEEERRALQPSRP
jgi:pSer/pThr/pTyr-binding forkhead associated (FHA) protein